jgi:hypothetical protein
MPTRVQRRKVGDTIDPEHHGFAVNDELLLPGPASAIDDPRITVRPVMAIPSEQPNPVAVPVNDHPIAVVFDLM